MIQSGLNAEAFTFNSDKFCGWLLMPLLFMVIEQDMGQRCFAAKSWKNCFMGSSWGGYPCVRRLFYPNLHGNYGKNGGC